MLNDQKNSRSHFKTSLETTASVRGLHYSVLVGLVAVLAGLGCALMPQAPRAEPASIFVKNVSGGHLRWVTLTEARKKSGQSVRLGTISPVPAGTSQGMGRRSDPPPLPLWVEVRWADAHGQQYGSEVSLEAILKKATGAPNEALVFRIYARGNLEVVLELETPQTRI
jgi:hypothetical protein